MARISLDLPVKVVLLFVKTAKTQPLHVSVVVRELTCTQISAQLNVLVVFTKM